MILTMDMKNDLFVLGDATLDALGRPKQVQLLINTQQRKLVLRACSAEDAEPIFLSTAPIISTEISGRKLLQNIRTNMGWAVWRAGSVPAPISRTTKQSALT